jgi:hypothetical protein
MANQRAVKFVRDLCALFHKFPISDLTKENYNRKISKWYLTASQWEDAMDMLIDSRDPNDHSLPELNEIFPILIRAQQKDRASEAFAWAWFRRASGIDYSIRVRNENHIWVIADLIWRDSKGMEHHLQRHVGEPVVDHIPVDAEQWGIAPDHRADPQSEEMPRQSEIREMVGRICNEKIRSRSV